MAVVCEGEYIGDSQGMNPRPCRDASIVDCHSYMKPVGGNLSVAEPTI